jgi:hypothetical protein
MAFSIRVAGGGPNEYCVPMGWVPQSICLTDGSLVLDIVPVRTVLRLAAIYRSLGIVPHVAREIRGCIPVVLALSERHVQRYVDTEWRGPQCGWAVCVGRLVVQSIPGTVFVVCAVLVCLVRCRDATPKSRQWQRFLGLYQGGPVLVAPYACGVYVCAPSAGSHRPDSCLEARHALFPWPACKQHDAPSQPAPLVAHACHPVPGE